MIDGSPKIYCRSVNPITYGYKIKDDDSSEYLHSEGIQEKISLKD